MDEAGAGSNRRIGLGDYELDLGSGELWRRGEPVQLAPQPTRLLVLLASRPGRLVTRDQIREAIWGETVVEFDAAINHAIREIRDALGDSASDPSYVETVPRRGYRMIAEVRERPTKEEEPDSGASESDGAPGRSTSEPGQARTPESGARSVWLPAAGGVLLVMLLVVGLSRPFADPASVTVIVVPARAATAGSAADSLAGPLTLALEGGLREHETGGVHLLEWVGPIAYDPDRRALVRDGEDLDVDVAVEANLSLRGDSLRAGVSLTDPGTGTQLWYRAFMHPLDDRAGAVARIQERVVEEVRGRWTSPAAR